MTRSMSEWTRYQNKDGVETFQRPMGLSEAAFVPQNVADGIGDMFVHASLNAPPDYFQRENVAKAWAVLRARHPLLLSRIVEDQTTGEWSFEYTTVTTEKALTLADNTLRYTSQSYKELLDIHYNGQRTLSNDLLSHLTISESPESGSYDIFMVTQHFIGDGTTLHGTVNDMILLLAEPEKLDEELEKALKEAVVRLPPCMESRLPQTTSKFALAAQQVEYQLQQASQLGGHVLERENRGPKKTVMEEIPLDEDVTVALLKICKSRGVTISNLMFVITALAWSRTVKLDPELPTLLYTALNLRSHLSPSECSYWFLALGYLNVMVPSFPPSTETIWSRAKAVRTQMTRQVSSPLLISRCLCMARDRYSRSFGKPSPSNQIIPLRAPSKALCGLSLMGDLDRIYQHGRYPPGIVINNVATASRQRPAGLLLLNHTFRKRLWLHLAWDLNGFREGVVEYFWQEVQTITIGLASL